MDALALFSIGTYALGAILLVVWAALEHQMHPAAGGCALAWTLLLAISGMCGGMLAIDHLLTWK